MNRHGFSLLFAVTLLLSRVVSAHPVTFDFLGQVDYITDPDNVVAATPIRFGSALTLSLRFDTDTPDNELYAADPTRGSFRGPGWIKLNIEGVLFEQASGVQVDILHGANGDQELFQAMANYPGSTSWPGLPGYYQTLIALWQNEQPHNMLANAELPDWVVFSRAQENHCVINADNYQIVFSISQIPEPSTLALSISALAVITVFGRVTMLTTARKQLSPR